MGFGDWERSRFCSESAIEIEMILKIDSEAKLVQSNRFGGHGPDPAVRALARAG